MAILRMTTDQLNSWMHELLEIKVESEKLNDHLSLVLNAFDSSWEDQEISVLVARLRKSQQLEEDKIGMIESLVEMIHKVVESYMLTENAFADSFLA